MGNSVEIFQESDEIAAYDNSILGAKSESMISFGKRMYRRSFEILTSPDRYQYTSADVLSLSEYINDFTVSEYDINITNINNNNDDIIHLGYWKNCSSTSTISSSNSNSSSSSSNNSSSKNSSSSSNSSSNSTAKSMRCILYLHNNTRSIVDALEVLPVAHTLNFDVISFDIPGCGRSSGVLSANIDMIIDKVISWYIAYYDNDSNGSNGNTTNPNDSPSFIIWARGMSTKYAIEYCHRKLSIIKFVVLDTPFVSIERIIEDLKNVLVDKGYYFVKTMTKIGTNIYRKEIKNRISVDVYDIKPIELVSEIELPCHILSTPDDDYISKQQSLIIRENWKGPCTLKDIRGNQFAPRSKDDVLSSVDMIRHHMRIRRV